MKGDGLLLNRRENELVWYLSKKGLKWIQANKQVKYVKNNIHHYIIRNQVYIHFKPNQWTTEKGFKLGKEIIRPDAIMETDKIYFVEIDRTQTMQANKEKIERYVRMKGNVNHFPIILYVTVSEYRQKQLRAMLNNLKSEVLLYNDIK